MPDLVWGTHRAESARALVLKEGECGVPPPRWPPVILTFCSLPLETPPSRMSHMRADPCNQRRTAEMGVIKDTVTSTFLRGVTCFGASGCHAVRIPEQLCGEIQGVRGRGPSANSADVPAICHLRKGSSRPGPAFR